MRLKMEIEVRSESDGSEFEKSEMISELSVLNEKIDKEDPPKQTNKTKIIFPSNWKIQLNKSLKEESKNF